MNAGTPSKNVIFWGLRLSLGQLAPESPVSQLQNGVSTSFLPPVILGILTFKDYPRSNSFFSMGILEGVKWKTSQAAYNGSKQQYRTCCPKSHKSVSFVDYRLLDTSIFIAPFKKALAHKLPNCSCAEY